MIYHLVDEILRWEKIVNPKIFKDIDGSGTGNGAIVDREERPKGGGIFVYLYGYKYPYKGNPDGGAVNNLATIKRNIRLILESLKSWPTKIMIGLLFLLPKWLMWLIIKDFVDYIYLMVDYYLNYHLLKPERYCRCAREYYRVFNLIAGKTKSKTEKRAIEIFRDLFCMSVEFDSAYRLRLWDIMLKASKKRLLENPKKEMERLFGILISREVYDGMKDRWGRTKKPILMALKIPFIKKIFKEFVKELSMKELMPDEADRYFCLLRQDYEFFG